MGFFKKKEVTAEEQARLDAEKVERERVKQEKAEAKEIQRAIDSAARAEKKEAKKAEEEAHIERFFGPNPTFEEKMNVSIYSWAIGRVRDQLLEAKEVVLATVPAEYDKSDKKEVKGVLIATNQKLIFSSNVIGKEFLEIMDYKSMTGISLESDGFRKKELHVITGREKRVFDDIKEDKQLKKLLDGVRKQISSSRSGGSEQTMAVSSQPDKYQQLEQLAKLKDQGILTEEEFKAEKTKVLTQ